MQECLARGNTALWEGLMVGVAWVHYTKQGMLNFFPGSVTVVRSKTDSDIFWWKLWLEAISASSTEMCFRMTQEHVQLREEEHCTGCSICQVDISLFSTTLLYLVTTSLHSSWQSTAKLVSVCHHEGILVFSLYTPQTHELRTWPSGLSFYSQTLPRVRMGKCVCIYTY